MEMLEENEKRGAVLPHRTTRCGESARVARKDGQQERKKRIHCAVSIQDVLLKKVKVFQMVAHRWCGAKEGKGEKL